MKKIDDFISVIIPVYNAEKTLDKLISNLEYALVVFDEYELIFIDDNSMDSSYSVLQGYALKDARISVIKLAENVGQQHATLLGLKKASGNCMLIMDDDLLHNATDILKLYWRLIRGYDIVYGVNKKQVKVLGHRQIGAKLRDWIFNVITDKPKDMKVCSFRIMNKKTAANVAKANTKFVYISMEVLKYTINVDNVLVKYHQYGAPTNYSLTSLISLFIGICVYYSSLRIFNKLRKKFEGYKVVSYIIGGVETCE